MTKMPKSITQHPGVLECSPAVGTDDIEDGGPRYDVILREGWRFEGLDPHEIRRTGFFRTVADFRAARPVQH
jgi:hypothetical protein